MEFDQLLLKHLGDLGRFQILIIAYVFFAGMQVAFNITESVFQAGIPEYWCSAPGLDPNLTTSLNHSQLLALIAPPEQRSERQCDVIDRDYASLTLDDVMQILESDVKNEPTVKCDQWEYDSSEFGRTIVNEVSIYFI